jgi:hypothetical protein
MGPKGKAVTENWTGGRSCSAALGGTLTWAFGRSTSSTGVVSNLALRNG